MRKTPKIKIIIEKHKDGYVGYPIGQKGIVVGQGDTYVEALNDVRSAIRFHVETFEGNLSKGRIVEAQQFVLDILGNRFGKRVANELKQAVQSVQNVDDLSALYNKAIRCRTPGAFRQLLAQKTKAPRHASAVLAAKQVFRQLLAQPNAQSGKMS